MKLRGTRRKLKKTSLCPLLNLCTRDFALNYLSFSRKDDKKKSNPYCLVNLYDAHTHKKKKSFFRISLCTTLSNIASNDCKALAYVH